MPVSVEVTSPATESESNHSEDEESIGMIEAAQKMISEDARKEFFAVRNRMRRRSTSAASHFLVEKIVSTIESKKDDAKLGGNNG